MAGHKGGDVTEKMATMSVSKGKGKKGKGKGGKAPPPTMPVDDEDEPPPAGTSLPKPSPPSLLSSYRIVDGGQRVIETADGMLVDIYVPRGDQQRKIPVFLSRADWNPDDKLQQTQMLQVELLIILFI
jgi:hypothetical protein